MGNGCREWFCFDGPSVWSTPRAIITHESISVVLVHAHVVFEADVVGELGGVIGLSVEVDPPDVSRMVGVGWVIVNIPFWSLQSRRWSWVTMQNQSFLRSGVVKSLLQCQRSGRILKTVFQSGGHHERLWARGINKCRCLREWDTVEVGGGHDDASDGDG